MSSNIYNHEVLIENLRDSSRKLYSVLFRQRKSLSDHPKRYNYIRYIIPILSFLSSIKLHDERTIHGSMGKLGNDRRAKELHTLRWITKLLAEFISALLSYYVITRYSMYAPANKTLPRELLCALLRAIGNSRIVGSR